jgi:hypothetical protein
MFAEIAPGAAARSPPPSDVQFLMKILRNRESLPWRCAA